MKILKYIILGLIVLLTVGLIGCDNLKCYPKFDLNGEYIGFECGGKF